VKDKAEGQLRLIMRAPNTRPPIADNSVAAEADSRVCQAWHRTEEVKVL
jgi:hypothetical protein